MNPIDRYRSAEAALWASFGLAPVERTVELGPAGSMMRVQEFGSGPPILFIHGGSASGANWAPLVQRLPGFRCLVIDRPGCGLSDPVDLTAGVGAFQRYADGFVGHALDAVGLARASVISTSLGGHIALRSAAKQPERIDHLVELGYCFGAPLRKVPTAMRITTLPGLGDLATRIPANRFVVRAILRQLGLGPALEGGLISDEFLDWFVSLLRDTDTLRNELTTNPALIHWRLGLNPDLHLDQEVLHSISRPTLVIWTEHDPIGGADVARSFARQIPDAQLELLPGGSHAPWIDQPDRCADAITAALT